MGAFMPIYRQQSFKSQLSRQDVMGSTRSTKPPLLLGMQPTGELPWNQVARGVRSFIGAGEFRFRQMICKLRRDENYPI